MTAHTHETDKELKLRAYHRAPWATLADGEMLSEEERADCYERIMENEDADNAERWKSKRK